MNRKTNSRKQKASGPSRKSHGKQGRRTTRRKG